MVCVFKSSFILYSNWLFNSSISERRSSFSTLCFFVAIIKLINIRNIIEGALKAVTGQLDGQRLPSSTVRNCQTRRSEIAKLDGQKLASSTVRNCQARRLEIAKLDGQRLPSSTVRNCQARLSEIAKLDGQKLPSSTVRDCIENYFFFIQALTGLLPIYSTTIFFINIS